MYCDVQDVVDSFLNKVEEDADYFSYYGVSDEEAMQQAMERSYGYLREAIVYLKHHLELDFDLSLNKTESGEWAFAELVTDEEVDILSEIMLLRYLERGFAKLKPIINTLSSTDLKLLHSPANERNSFVSMIDKVREHVRTAVSHYAAIDRKTGKRKLMSQYGTFDNEEELE